MRIGIDARLITYRRGIGNYIYNLLVELAKFPNSHQYFLYVHDLKALEISFENSCFTMELLRPAIYPVWEQILLPQRIRQDKLDILYCPANTAPLAMPAQTRLVVTIHDVMYLLPKTVLPPLQSRYQKLGKLYRKWVVPQIAKKASIITTVSEYSRVDLLQQLKVNSNRVKVIYEAQGPAFRKLDNVDAIQSVRRKFGLAENIIFALGAIDPRKNTIRVIDAFLQFKNRVNSPHQLVIAGLDTNARSIFTEQAQKIDILKDVVLLGFVTEEELVALYNAADIVVYPSLYEGFGLPVLEAMACGAPVITSQVTSIPEIAGDAALLVDPLNTSAIAEAMLQIVNDLQLKQNLIKQGLEQVKNFSWTKAAHELLTVFEQVAIQ